MKLATRENVIEMHFEDARIRALEAKEQEFLGWDFLARVYCILMDSYCWNI